VQEVVLMLTCLLGPALHWLLQHHLWGGQAGRPLLLLLLLLSWVAARLPLCLWC
jgi:hypothetical protein